MKVRKSYAPNLRLNWGISVLKIEVPVTGEDANESPAQKEDDDANESPVLKEDDDANESPVQKKDDDANESPV